MSLQLRGTLILLLGVFVLTLMDGFNKYLVGQFAAVQLLFLRNLLVAPIAVATVANRSPRYAWLPRPIWLHFIRTLVITVEMVMVVSAFSMMELADAHAILAATPLIVLALAGPLLGETIGARRWIAVCVGMIGVLVVVRPGVMIVGPGAVLVLLSTVLYAFYQILTRMVMRVEGVATTYAFQSTVSAALLAVPAVVFWRTPEAANWLLITLVAALGGIGHLCVIRAFQLAPAAVLQPFTYSQIIFAVFVGWIAFGDLPDVWTTLGAAIVVAAGIYAVWHEAGLQRQDD